MNSHKSEKLFSKIFHSYVLALVYGLLAKWLRWSGLHLTFKCIFTQCVYVLTLIFYVSMLWTICYTLYMCYICTYMCAFWGATFGSVQDLLLVFCSSISPGRFGRPYMELERKLGCTMPKASALPTLPCLWPWNICVYLFDTASYNLEVGFIKRY